MRGIYPLAPAFSILIYCHFPARRRRRPRCGETCAPLLPAQLYANVALLGFGASHKLGRIILYTLLAHLPFLVSHKIFFSRARLCVLCTYRYTCLSLSDFSNYTTPLDDNSQRRPRTIYKGKSQMFYIYSLLLFITRKKFFLIYSFFSLISLDGKLFKSSDSAAVYIMNCLSFLARG